MPERTPNFKKFANQQLDRLIENPGEVIHPDASGKLDREKIDAEIGAKVGQVSMARQMGGGKRKAQQALKRIAETFPEKKDEVKRVLKETGPLSDIADTLNGESKKSRKM